MEKKGEFQLSFSMIFSIIVIIAIIGIAFYVITYFLSLSKCTEVGLFYDDFKKHIDRAWRASIHEDSNALKDSTLPSSIEFVCFGNHTQTPLDKYKKQYNYFRGYEDENFFLYPANKACDGELSALKLEHVRTENFFCVPVKNNRIKIKTIKDYSDSLVTIQDEI